MGAEPSALRVDRPVSSGTYPGRGTKRTASRCGDRAALESGRVERLAAGRGARPRVGIDRPNRAARFSPTPAGLEPAGILRRRVAGGCDGDAASDPVSAPLAVAAGR